MDAWPGRPCHGPLQLIALPIGVEVDPMPVVALQVSINDLPAVQLEAVARRIDGNTIAFPHRALVDEPVLVDVVDVDCAGPMSLVVQPILAVLDLHRAGGDAEG